MARPWARAITLEGMVSKTLGFLPLPGEAAPEVGGEGGTVDGALSP